MLQNVIDLLIEDHREVEALVRQLLTEEQAEPRRELADAVIGHLVRHAVAEETIVYPVIRTHLPDGEQAVEHDKEEHKRLETLMKEMEGAETGGPEFFDLVGRLQTVLSDHVQDEEQEQFPLLREKLSGELLTGMGAAVEALKLVAPTRPHPEAPQSALFHLTVGPGVGLVDRLRDALSSKTKTYTGTST
jgi:hemerythrin superfamily protein